MLLPIITPALLLCSAAFAAPAAEVDYKKIDYPKGTGENLHEYPAPPGGWESVDYPKGTGENLPYYPPPKGGWENVKYPPGTGAGGNTGKPGDPKKDVRH